jgi:hypothetical protein
MLLTGFRLVSGIKSQVFSVRLLYVRFEIFPAVTMKNAVFWDIKTQFVPHRRHITSRLQRPAGKCYVRFEVFTVVAMKSELESESESLCD